MKWLEEVPKNIAKYAIAYYNFLQASYEQES